MNKIVRETKADIDAGQTRRDRKTLLSEELLDRIGSRAAAYDREARFFHEDLDDLKAVGYLTLSVPKELGGKGFTLPEIVRRAGAAGLSGRIDGARDQHAISIGPVRPPIFGVRAIIPSIGFFRESTGRQDIRRRPWRVGERSGPGGIESHRRADRQWRLSVHRTEDSPHLYRRFGIG